MKNFKLFSFLCFIALGLVMTSCGDDEVTGCTDSTAENYDALATLEGTCTYAADKFIGDYVGSSTCNGQLVIPTLTNPDLMFSVAAQVGAGKNDVTISIPIQGTPVAFGATVVGNTLTVGQLLEGLPFPNPSGGDAIAVNIQADGDMIFDDATNSATGDIDLTITLNATGSTLDIGACTITGVKQ